MKAVFYKNSGSKSDTKTYTQVRIQPDAGDSDWEGTNNGMSDTYYRVTTEEKHMGNTVPK